MKNSYDIVKEKGYYTVYVNGKFYCTCDTYREAANEVAESMNKEEE